MTAPDPTLSSLTRALDNLPGIGQRQAERLAEWLMYRGQSEAGALASVLATLPTLARCDQCNRLVAGASCTRCERDHDLLVVTESEADARQIREAVNDVSFYVLHGVLSPASNLGPAQLQLDRAVARILTSPSTVMVLADSVEGRATGEYLNRRCERQSPIVGVQEFIQSRQQSNAQTSEPESRS
ncbi:MAG: recombination protein RecR [Pseudomonadota bacterium]|nr:recombination protein RecR [Pseudomonadota bacterium]